MGVRRLVGGLGPVSVRHLGDADAADLRTHRQHALFRGQQNGKREGGSVGRGHRCKLMNNSDQLAHDVDTEWLL